MCFFTPEKLGKMCNNYKDTAPILLVVLNKGLINKAQDNDIWNINVGKEMKVTNQYFYAVFVEASKEYLIFCLNYSDI